MMTLLRPQAAACQGWQPFGLMTSLLVLQGRDKDLLFLALEHKKVAVLEWDAERSEHCSLIHCRR